MKRLLIIMILAFPIFTIGQVDLCRNCAVTIYDADNPKKCCEECLRDFYLTKTRQNITHGKLSDYYNYADWSGLLPFPDTLSAHFSVLYIESHKGYSLQDSELIESNYFLVHLECKDNVVPTGTSIVLIVNDSSLFGVGHDYYLKLLPYFKRNQDFRIVNGQCVTIVGDGTVFDLVYKQWLVVFLPVRQNYFFLSSQ